MHLCSRGFNSPKIVTVGQYLFLIGQLSRIGSYNSVYQVGMDAFMNPNAEDEFHFSPGLLLQLHGHFLDLAGKGKGH